MRFGIRNILLLPWVNMIFEKKYERLECHRLAVKLAAEIIIYVTDMKPYRVSEQIGASALSISSNIAEGAYYQNDKDFVRFLRYARGSSAELDSQLCVLIQMGHPTERIQKWREQLSRIQVMITNLQKSIARRIEASKR